MNQPIKWHGGKHYLAKKIVNLMPGHRVDFDLPNNASSKKTKERKIESVWMNFDS